MKTWLVLDATYLCHRAFHSTGNLTYGDTRTGVLFGFMRDLVVLNELLQPERFVFCFDSHKSIRRKMYAKYKQGRVTKRKEASDEDKIAYQGMQQQIVQLRSHLLTQLGFSNVFWKTGYEADDVIAGVCLQNTNTKLIVVGSDHDLFQLLTPNVMMWNPNKQKMTTEKSFTELYGITPRQWVDVKAIAGCSGDDVQGIKGVGEKTAIKFLTGKLKMESSAAVKIVMHDSIWRRNLKLVTLPLPGLGGFEVKKDYLSERRWKAVCRRYGMTSLAPNPVLLR
jgi:DNA polymerase-1